MDNRTVNITVVTCNRLELTRKTLTTVRKGTDWPYLVTVVDNGSSDGTVDYLRQGLREGLLHNLILLEKNMGVAVAANLGWASVDTPYYLKLDNDIEIFRAGWLHDLISLAGSKEIGVAALPTLFSVQAEETTLTSGDKALVADHCGGACTLIRRDVHDRFGYWCEDYGIYGEEDADYGTRVGLGGLLNAYYPDFNAARHIDHGAETIYRPAKEREARRRNIEQFLTNVHAYRNGIRPLRMARKYDALVDGENIAFKRNSDYSANLGAWNAHRKKVVEANRRFIDRYIARIDQA